MATSAPQPSSTPGDPLGTDTKSHHHLGDDIKPLSLAHGKVVDANLPVDVEGRVYHVGVKRGEVANRILSVGDPNRAYRIAKMLDVLYFERQSNRGFTIFTGRYMGVPLSIVAIGMGVAMMDFFVREVRAIVDGPMVVIRFGSCGALGKAEIGQIAVAREGCIMINRNPDHFVLDPSIPAYSFSGIVHPDERLSNSLYTRLRSSLGQDKVVSCLNATADSFYSSQGRLDSNFDDANRHLLSTLARTYLPLSQSGSMTLEMETFQLFQLSRACHKEMRVAAATMIFANRFRVKEFLANEEVERLEEIAGKAVLMTLAEYPIEEQTHHPAKGSVWEVDEPISIENPSILETAPPPQPAGLVDAELYRAPSVEISMIVPRK